MSKTIKAALFIVTVIVALGAAAIIAQISYVDQAAADGKTFGECKKLEASYKPDRPEVSCVSPIPPIPKR